MKRLFKKSPPGPLTPVDISRALKASVPVAVSAPLAEGRGHVRRDAWCECEIRANGELLREAVILDISASGARIRSRVRGLLPRFIVIRAPRLGLNRPARVVWQDSNTAGIQFISPKPVSPTTA